MNEESQYKDPGIYQIKIIGLIHEIWAEWFDGATITPLGENETLLVCSVKDQSALHGLLAKIRDLGLVLHSVIRIENQT